MASWRAWHRFRSFFAGYDDRYRGDHELGLTQSDRTVFLKVGYAWAL